MATCRLKPFDSSDEARGYVINASGPIEHIDDQQEILDWFRENDIDFVFMIGANCWYAVTDPILDADTLCLARMRFA
jgi:hypothetical protein